MLFRVCRFHNLALALCGYLVKSEAKTSEGPAYISLLKNLRPLRVSTSFRPLPSSISNMLMLMDTNNTGTPSVRGNASEEIKHRLGDPSKLFLTRDLAGDGRYKSTGYSMEIFRRLKVTEISFEEHPEETTKRVSRVVCELNVEPGESQCLCFPRTFDRSPTVVVDMANNEHHLHGACGAYLVDMQVILSSPRYPS